MNRLPWFTHDHNARNDDFLQRAEDKFGAFGYAAYFKILEILHEHGTGDILKITRSRLCRELRSRWPQVELYLNFSRTSGKLQFKSSSTEVELQIKKFRERQSKMKSNLLSTFRQPSVNLPQEEEEEVEKENNIAAAPPDIKIVDPKPKKRTPLQEIIRAFKKAKGLDPDDAVWDKKFFSRHTRPGNDLLKAFNGDPAAAIIFLLGKAYDFHEAGLDDWGLEAVIKAAARDYKKIDGGENGNEHKPVVPDSVLGRSRYQKATHAGRLAFDALRAIKNEAIPDQEPPRPAIPRPDNGNADEVFDAPFLESGSDQ